MSESARGLSRIRAVRAADLPALETLERASFTGDRLSRRSFRRFLAGDNAALLVEEEDGRIRAYGLLLFRKQAPDRARLYSFAVAKDQRGKGVATSLLAACESRARARGCTRMSLEIRRDNKAAQALYLKAGFEIVGTRPAYYEDRMAALRLEKGLDAAARRRDGSRASAAARLGDA
jgi:ribosomal-protein-alanine acetyltransferase